jgi:ribosomal-protein-alanine N-acetyltransferase
MKKSTMSVRPAVEEDLDQIYQIEKRAYKHPWTKEQLLEEIDKKDSSFLVYTDDETDSVVAGYLVYRKEDNQIHILNVAVALDWRGLGMGKSLVQLAIKDAYRQQLERVFLEVREDNEAAIGLYTKCGFKIDRVQKGFYTNGDHAVHMSLKMSYGAPSEDTTSETVTYH